MITAEFVNRAIESLLNRFRIRDYIRRMFVDVEFDDYYNPFKIYFFVEKELEMMLESLGIEHDVKLIEIDENRWYVQCCYKIDGKMYARNFVAEIRY